MCRRVNTSDLEEVASAINPSTKLVWLESPTNPRQQITDIRVRYSDYKVFGIFYNILFLLFGYLY